MHASSRPIRAVLVPVLTLVLGAGALSTGAGPAAAAGPRQAPIAQAGPIAQAAHVAQAAPALPSTTDRGEKHPTSATTSITEVLTEPMHGRAAVKALGGRLTPVAHLNDRGPRQLTALLADDPTVWVDPSGRLFVKEATAPQATTESGALAGATTSAPLDQTFALHSLPGSHHTIYLDFDGVDLDASSQWVSQGLAPGHFAGWDPRDDGAAQDDRERAAIQEVWARVAEDYAPFDVDVTTQDPGAAALTRTGPADQDYGTHLVVTDSTDAWDALCGQQCGGVAWVGTFGATEAGDEYQVAWVFADGVSDFPRYVAEAASHEVGHTLGLTHDGLSSVPADNYYTGHAMWAPIMGSGYDHGVTQWSKGDYLDANNQQDDVALIAERTSLRTDDAGNTRDSAGHQIEGTKFITGRNDLDYFSLGTCVGAVTLSAAPAPTGPDLDILLAIVDAQGDEVAAAAPATTETTALEPWPWADNLVTSGPVISGLGSSVAATVPQGHYYAVVDGAGATDGGLGDVWADYDDYGSLGSYTMSATGCVADTVVPQAPGTAVAGIGTGGFSVTWTPPGDDGGSEVSGYELVLDGGTPVQVGPGTTTYTWPGTTLGRHTATVAAINSQGTGPVTSASARREVPGAPRLVTTSVATNPDGYDPALLYFRTTWEPPLDNGARNIQSYRFEMEFTPGSWELVDTLTADPNELTNIFTHYTEGIDLTPGARPIGLRVQAVNDAGSGPWLTLQGHIDGPPLLLRSDEVDITVDKLAHTVTVDWTDPYDGGKPILGTRLSILVDNPADLQHPVVTELHDLPAGTTTYTFHDLAAGNHRIGIDPYNTLGGNRASFLVTMPQLLPPEPVSQFAPVQAGFDRSTGKGTATISWTAPYSDAQLPITGYDVTVDGAAPIRVGPSVTTWTLRDLALGSTHTVQVAAVNLVGPGEPYGPPDIAIVTTPTAVTDLRTTVDRRDPTDLVLDATWTESSDNGGDWMHQTYFWRLQPVGGTIEAPWQTAYSTPTLQARGVLPGDYTLQVKAQNQLGDSPTTSLPVTVRLPDAPAAVGNLHLARLILANSWAAVTWDVPEDGGSPVTGYRVVVTDETTGHVAAPATASEASYVLTDVVEGHTYLVEVTPRNVRGDGPSRSVRFVAAGAPSEVTDLRTTADRSRRSVTARWSPPGFDGGAPVRSYSVRLDGGDWYELDAGTTSITFTAVATGTHTVQVRAANGSVDDEGRPLVSSASSTVTLLAPPTAPSAPGIGAARPGKKGGKTTAVFAWSAPANTGGAALDRFEVDILTLKNGRVVKHAKMGAKASGRKVEVTLRRKKGVTYAAVVRARNGVGWSPVSKRSKAVTPR